MASGLPVVAPRAGGILDTMIDRETGFLFEPDDIPAMIYAIQRFIGFLLSIPADGFYGPTTSIGVLPRETILDQLIADYHQIVLANNPLSLIKIKTVKKTDSLSEIIS